MISLKHRIFLVLLGLLVALFAGAYLSGRILLTWVHSHQSTEFMTIFQCLYHYGDHPVRGIEIKISAFVGFLAPFLLLTFFAAALLAYKEEDLYGKARLAKSSESQKADFFESTENSIIVGKQGNQYLFYSGRQFALLVAPTRPDRGVGIIIPNLLSYQGSMVVLDIEQKNFDLTNGFREKYGQRVYLFNSFAEDQCTYRWNPLDYVSEDPSLQISDLSSIANMLYPTRENPRNRFRLSQAQDVSMALALFLLDKHKRDGSTLCSIGASYRLPNSDGRGLRDYLREVSEAPSVSRQCKPALAGILGQSEETFGSIMATFKGPLLPWLNPIVDAATSADDFLLTDIRKRKMIIYIDTQPNKLAGTRLIINLFFNQLINLNTKELPQSNKELRYQCLLLMDEFISIGAVGAIAKSASCAAGYNIRLSPIIQSLIQLDSVYGREVSRTMVTNHAL